MEDKPKRKYTRRLKIEGEDATEQVADQVEVQVEATQPDVSQSQSMAERIFNGQSPDLPTIERLKRIKNALVSKGMSTDITLPVEDFKKYW